MRSVILFFIATFKAHKLKGNLGRLESFQKREGTRLLAIVKYSLKVTSPIFLRKANGKIKLIVSLKGNRTLSCLSCRGKENERDCLNREI